jgi:rare lipoprotein A
MLLGGFLALLAGLALLAAGCSHARRAPEPRGVERGVASWYGPKFNGRATASGERYDMYAMTAAHPSLPFGTVLEVRNLDNGKTCWVRVNDRGPFVRGRIVDLSLAAAREIDMVGPGTARVELAVVSPGLPRPLPPLEATPVLASAPAPVPSPAPTAPIAEPVPASAPAPSAPRAPIRVEVSVPDAPAYTVQVGAFSERERADTLRNLLSGRFPQVAVRSDGTWHRVQVGSFDDRAAANRLRRELERLGWVALVVALR